MKKTYWKNIFREVGATKNRFFAIMVIVALGVCMFTGLMVTSPDMKFSADHYFDQSNLMDIRVISTLGLTDNDLQKIAAIEGVDGVMGAKSADALFEDSNKNILAGRIQSIPQNSDEKNNNYINQFTLIEGKMPTNPQECVIVNSMRDSGVRIGQTLKLAQDNKDLSGVLAKTEWEVVGIVDVPTNFSINPETVTVGDGQADLLLFAPMEAFEGEIYTTIYLTVKDAKKLDTYSNEYHSLIETVTEQLEQLGISQSEIRKDEVIEQAQQQLDEAKAEYESKKQEAESQLNLAKSKLQEAEVLIQENEIKLKSGQAEWSNGLAMLSQKKTELSQTLSQKQQEITQARQQLLQGKEQLGLAKRQLETYKMQYEQALSAKQQVESGKQQLEQAKQQLQMMQQAVDTAETMLPNMKQAATVTRQAAEQSKQQAQQIQSEKDALLAKEEIQQGLAVKPELDAILAQHPEYSTIEDLLQNPPLDMPSEKVEEIRLKNQQYQTAKIQVDAAEFAVKTANLKAQQLEQSAKQAEQIYKSTEKTVVEGKQSLESGQKLLIQKEQQLKQAEEMLKQYEVVLQTAPAMLEQAEKQILETETVLNQGQSKLEEGVLALSLAPAQAQLEFDKAQEELDNAKKQLEEGQLQLEQGKQELADGKKEFEDQQAQATEQLNDAEDQLIDAQREIDKIDSCEWYVLDRDTLVSSAMFESNADKLESIAKVFPVFFFLVAGLVALTTMTRMVDENRTQIGCLKALGYGEAAITTKYLLYAVSASLAGSAVGLVAGFFGIPLLLWNAYTAMYQLPQFILQVDVGLAIAAVSFGLLCTAGATINACHSTLKEKPASLLMPKAPKAGKRIFLEKIPFIWNKMKFTHKVTARNLFRYKKRFFMTIVGIAGCTALLMVGFGIQDSIMDLVDTQYEQLWHYDLSIGMNHASALEGRRGIEDILNDSSKVEESLVLHEKNIDISAGDSERMSVTVNVPQEVESFSDFVTLRSRLSKTPVAFDENSVVLTEKVAELLGLKAGDTVTAEIDGKRIDFVLTGITENYLGSNLYVAPDIWKELVGEPDWNMVLAKTTCKTAEQRSELSQTILEKDDIKSAVFVQDSSEMFSNSIENINDVVVVVILFAALLAIVVLYNLININIGERKKELATIKVLGFYENEVSNYIFREIDVLSVIGALCGLVLGVPLHLFVIKTVEIDQMMFIRTIHWSSYIYSFALTMVFTVIVSLIMKRSLKKIDMVESLKAPE